MGMTIAVAVDFPVGDTNTLLVAAVVIVVLLGGGIAIELLRQRQQRRLVISAEWRQVDEILKEKKLSQEQQEQLTGLIRRWDPRHPLRATTLRSEFDLCVRQEMNRLDKNGDQATKDAAGHSLRDIRHALGLDYIPIGHPIRSTRELYEGQQVWMAPDVSGAPRWFQATVSAVDEARFFVTPRGGSAGPAGTLSAGSSLRCRMWREEDARYVFSVQLQGFEENPLTLHFRHVAGLKRLQSRAHFRVHHAQATTVGLFRLAINDDLRNLNQRPIDMRLRGQITNISEGGMALILQRPLPIENALRVTVELPGSKPFAAFARVVATDNMSGGRYLVRCAFIGMSDEHRSRIGHFVMHRQQRQHASQMGKSAVE